MMRFQPGTKLPRLVSTFFGAGISAAASSRPSPLPFLFFAVPVMPSQQLWSITEANFGYDAKSHKVVTTLSTGVGTPLRSFGPHMALWSYASPGVTTNGGSTGAAVNVGAFLKVDTKHGNFVPGWKRIISGASPTVDQFVVAWGWSR